MMWMAENRLQGVLLEPPGGGLPKWLKSRQGGAECWARVRVVRWRQRRAQNTRMRFIMLSATVKIAENAANRL